LSKEWVKDSKESLKIQLQETTKRRSTMNSRTINDEEEMLRKALEESKAERLGNGSESVATSRRPGGKRAREDSEE
jgi:hypothetical protein